MRVLALILMVGAIGACSDAGTDHAKNGGGTLEAAEKSKPDPNFVELRFKVPKASLPASLAVEPTGNTAPPKRPLTPAELTALQELIKGRGLTESLGPGCFRVCDVDCHEVGNRTICFHSCHIECGLG